MEETVEQEQQNPLIDGVLKHLASVIGNISGGSWKGTIVEGQVSAGDAEIAKVAVAFRGTFRGRLTARVSAEALATIPELAEETGSPLSRWVRESLESWRNATGTPVFEATVLPEEEGGSDGGAWTFTFTAEDGRSLTMEISCDAELAASIAEAGAAFATPLVFDEPVSEARNLELVLDVELNVVLRFGQRQLSLREVLDLTSGSVIELDRQVEEPVELLLDGKVIARGEAVVIDGNYGLRVTEVPQPISHSMLPSA